MIAWDLISPRLDAQELTDRHEPLIGHLFGMTLDQDTPSRLVRLVPVIDLERRSASSLCDVQLRSDARSEQDRARNEGVVDRKDHRLASLIEPNPADLLTAKKFSAFFRRQDVESLMVRGQQWNARRGRGKDVS
jgi:hypothetical protein